MSSNVHILCCGGKPSCSSGFRHFWFLYYKQVVKWGSHRWELLVAAHHKLGPLIPLHCLCRTFARSCFPVKRRSPGGARGTLETRFAAKPLRTFKIATFKLQIAKNSLCHYRWPFCIIFAEFGAWWAENCMKFSMSLAKGLNSSLGHAVPSLLIPFSFPPLVRHVWSLPWDADGDGHTATSEWALAVCEQVSVASPLCCPSEHLHSWAIEKKKKREKC